LCAYRLPRTNRRSLPRGPARNGLTGPAHGTTLSVMTSLSIDTLALARKLTAYGMPEGQAEAVATALAESLREGAVTPGYLDPVSYTHLRAHETVLDLVCRLLLEKKNNRTRNKNNNTIMTTPNTHNHTKLQTSSIHETCELSNHTVRAPHYH